MGSESKAAKKAERERLIAERQELEKSRAAMTPEERQRDLVRRQAENFPTDQSIAMDLNRKSRKAHGEVVTRKPKPKMVSPIGATSDD